jgi:hypothetical protein
LSRDEGYGSDRNLADVAVIEYCLDNFVSGAFRNNILLLVRTNPMLYLEDGFTGIVDEIDWSLNRFASLEIEGREHSEGGSSMHIDQ